MFSKSILASIFILVLCIAVSQEAAAQIPGITPPSVKMGLWEETTTANGTTFKSRSCVTQQSYQAAFGKMMPSCTISDARQTSNSIDADLSCSSHGTSSNGHLSVQLPDSGTAHTTMTYTASVQGHPMQGTITTDSHWVSSSCGNIPPGESRDVE